MDRCRHHSVPLTQTGPFRWVHADSSKCSDPSHHVIPLVSMWNGDMFHAHLDICERCSNEPFNLCPTGARLLTP